MQTRDDRPLAVVSGGYGARILRDVLGRNGLSHVPVIEVVNSYFGGNTAVAGLMTYADVRGALTDAPEGHRFLLPDVCLNDGVFLDGGTIDQLRSEFDVEVIATSGQVLRDRLSGMKVEVAGV